MTWRGLLDDLTDTVSEAFGEPVLYWRAGKTDGPPIEVAEAVFDPAFHESDAGGKVSVGTVIPVLDIRDRDIGGPPAETDECEIEGVRYVVRSLIPSTSGMTKAVLRRRR